MRELAVRQDRLPQDERIDLPEIQESFRVSFSDEARLTESMATRNALASQDLGQYQAQDPTKLYRQVAAL